jgi:hypothetical protein
MYKTLLSCFLALFVYSANAQTVTANSPPGLLSPVVINVPSQGVVRWNTPAVSVGSAYTTGNCVLDYVTVGVYGQQVNVGATCYSEGTIALTTTGQFTTSCPIDGGMTQPLKLSVSFNGQTFYDAPLITITPVQCFQAPAVPAKTTWNPATRTVTFDNSTQARVSAPGGLRVADPAWLYSQHQFIVPEGISCYAATVDKGTRWAHKYVEVGFICYGTVPASSTSSVYVN